MRPISGVILTLFLSLPVLGQNRQQQPAPQNGQQPATPFSFPGLPYDPHTDPRLTDPSYVPRVFQLHYVDARWLEQLLFPYGAIVERQDNLNSIAVRAPSAVIDKIDALIKQMDVPANKTKSISLTCHLILASPVANPAESIRPELKPIIDQLRNVLGYKSYSVLDTIIGTTTEGKRFQLTGSVGKTSDAVPWPESYTLIMTANVNGEGTNQTIRLDPINFSADIRAILPNQGERQLQRIGIDTSLDMKLGQQIVVGKTTVHDHAFILVMSAKID